MCRTVDVAIESKHTYPIKFGRGLRGDFRAFCADHYRPDKLLVAIDEEVQRLHGKQILKECATYFDECVLFEIPQGEQSKSVTQWNNLLDKLLKEDIERSTPLLAVGGGVTGDLAGFTAASALRGLPLIHMPTTLLAMVDSSIGGKTGINHTKGKNLIGAFYQPDAVFADADFLETLPHREWVNGLAEVLKYAAISKPELFEDVRHCVNQGFRPAEEWVSLIYKSASIKVDIVQKDTLEAGKRQFLNFGHTFGHALEKNAGYGTISHGEAVLTGMIAAIYTSQKLGSPVETGRLEDFLKLYSINLDKASIPVEKLVHSMRHDKKVHGGDIRLVLLKEWGGPYMYTCNDMSLLHEAWDFAFDRINEYQIS